jgi:hypothetical protein
MKAASVSRLFFTFLVLFGIGKPLDAQPKPQTTDLDGYYSLLMDVAEAADIALETENLDSLASILRKIPDTLYIRLIDSKQNEKVKMVTNGWLKKTLEPNGTWATSNLEDSLRMAAHLTETLYAYQTEIEESWSSQLSDSSASGKVKSILNDGKYKRKVEKKAETVFEERLRERPVSSGSSRGSSGMVWVFFGIMVLIFGVLMLLMGRNIDFTVTPEEVKVEVGRGLIKKGEPTKSEGMKQKAALAAREGSFHEAVRFYYLHFILHLHERRIILYRPSYTSGEYQAMLKSMKMAEPSMEKTTGLFDHVIYGGKMPGKDQWNEFVNGIDHSIKATRGAGK